MKTPLQTLEAIRLEMAKIREIHSKETKAYILNKTKFDVLSTKFVLIDAKGKSMAEKEREAKKVFEADYLEYKAAKASSEALDREFRNLDAQSRILMVRIKNEEQR